MPELPEVEATRRLIEAHCAGKTVAAVRAVEQGGGPRDGLFDDVVFERTTDAAFAAALTGRVLSSAHRAGKVLWWRLSGAGPHPLFHLGMSGAFLVRPPRGTPLGISYVRAAAGAAAPGAPWPPRFCKLEVEFSDGTRLAFTDPRRFGAIELAPDPAVAPRVAALGPDALTSPLPAPAFAAALRARAVPIKGLLLDQTFVAGIGNWVADEVLFAARLHPSSPADALDPDDAARLHAAIAAVLSHAVAVDADYARFPAEWLFAHRWGKGKGGTPTTAAGGRVSFVTVAGRTSAVVLAEQRLLRRAKGLGGAGGEAGARAAGAGVGSGAARKAAGFAATAAPPAYAAAAAPPAQAAATPPVGAPASGAASQPVAGAARLRRGSASAAAAGAAAMPAANVDADIAPAAAAPRASKRARR